MQALPSDDLLGPKYGLVRVSRSLGVTAAVALLLNVPVLVEEDHIFIIELCRGRDFSRALGRVHVYFFVRSGGIWKFNLVPRAPLSGLLFRARSWVQSVILRGHWLNRILNSVSLTHFAG
jgi:hypothetical protein